MLTPFASLNRFGILVGLSFSIIFICHCAQQGTPTGGAKDTITPQLVKSIPENKSRNFRGNEIILTFDEYIQVENLQQELIITPNVESEYESKPTKYGLRLIFKKPFNIPNTTYTFNFRNAIKDITEKNSANAKLVFSTGSQLDTLYIEGVIKDLLTGQAVENAVVSLYRQNDTLDIKKNKPYYFTKTDKEGKYILENLHSGEYNLYALEEKNNNLRYDQEKEKIAFMTLPLELKDSSLRNINLKIRVIDETQPTIRRRTPQSDTYIIEMNEGLIEAQVTLVDSKQQIPYILEKNNPNTIRLYNNTLQRFDSLQVRIMAKDSADNLLETQTKIKFEELDEKRRKTKTELPFVVATDPERGNAVEKRLNYKLTFTKPVQVYDLEKVQLLADTLTPISLDTSQDFTWNKSHTTLTLQKDISIKQQVRVLFPKGTFISIENDTLEMLKADHPLKRIEDYGSIAGYVTTKASYYVIQLLGPDGKVVAQQRNTPAYLFSYLPAGEYTLRVIIDSNNNGQWDAGSFIKYQPAEDIIYGFEKKKLKANWELTGQDVTIQ